MTSRAPFIAAALVAAAAALGAQQPPAAPLPDEGRDSYRFKSGVELVNVTATVSDSNGRFVPGLQQEDFVVYEDGQRQEVTYFSPERIPISLGIVLDTSGSMAGEKMGDAKAALDRFVYDLLDERDEVFLYRFSDTSRAGPGLDHRPRPPVARDVAHRVPNGGTAMYDAVLDAIPLAEKGHRQKKAIVVISDGNDTSSSASLRDVRDRLRGSDVLVYAIGIDGESVEPFGQPPHAAAERRPSGRFRFRPAAAGGRAAGSP